MARETVRDQLVVGPRLGDEILRAAFEGRARHIDGAERGDQNDGELRIARANFAEQFEAVAIGQAYIEQQRDRTDDLRASAGRLRHFRRA